MSADVIPDPGAVAGLDFLLGLSGAAVIDATGLARCRAVPLGARIFDQGQSTERAHALLAGGVRISQFGSDGEQVVIRFIGAGEIFGSAAIYTDGRYPGEAIAIADSVELSWSESDWQGLLERHPRIAINMIGIIGRRLAELQERVRELATQRAERRIAHSFLRLLRQAGRSVATGTEIDFPLRRKDIADISGTTLHTVSRVLTAWQRKGLLVSNAQRLTILSVDEIGRIAETITGPDRR